MTNETDKVEYIDAIVDLLIRITDSSSESIAADLWKYYPTETALLLRALVLTKDTPKVARLLQKEA